MVDFETAEILFCKTSMQKYKKVKVPWLDGDCKLPWALQVCDGDA